MCHALSLGSLGLVLAPACRFFWAGRWAALLHRVAELLFGLLGWDREGGQCRRQEGQQKRKRHCSLRQATGTPCSHDSLSECSHAARLQQVVIISTRPCGFQAYVSPILVAPSLCEIPLELHRTHEGRTTRDGWDAIMTFLESA